MSIPHGALCGSEVCDCGVAVLVLCLFLMVPCVALNSVIVVWLSFLTAPCVALRSVIGVGLSKVCVYFSRRPV